MTDKLNEIKADLEKDYIYAGQEKHLMMIRLTESIRYLIERVEELEKHDDQQVVAFNKKKVEELESIIDQLRTNFNTNDELFKDVLINNNVLKKENESLKAKCMKVATAAGDLKLENEKLKKVVEISKTLVSVASLYSAEHHYDFEKDIQAYDTALKQLEGGL